VCLDGRSSRTHRRAGKWAGADRVVFSAEMFTRCTADAAAAAAAAAVWKID